VYRSRHCVPVELLPVYSIPVLQYDVMIDDHDITTAMMRRFQDFLLDLFGDWIFPKQHNNAAGCWRHNVLVAGGMAPFGRNFTQRNFTQRNFTQCTFSAPARACSVAIADAMLFRRRERRIGTSPRSSRGAACAHRIGHAAAGSAVRRRGPGRGRDMPQR
jgi:hypothetical protein